MARKKLLYQRSTNDCGIACVAMLLGETYKAARAMTAHYFERVLGQKFDGITAEQLRGISSMFGERAKVWRITKANRKAVAQKLAGRSAILIVPAVGYPPGAEWHAVYWDGQKLHDPAPKGKCRRYGENGAQAMAKAITAIVLHADDKHCSVEDVG